MTDVLTDPDITRQERARTSELSLQREATQPDQGHSPHVGAFPRQEALRTSLSASRNGVLVTAEKLERAGYYLPKRTLVHNTVV